MGFLQQLQCLCVSSYSTGDTGDSSLTTKASISATTKSAPANIFTSVKGSFSLDASISLKVSLNFNALQQNNDTADSEEDFIIPVSGRQLDYNYIVGKGIIRQPKVTSFTRQNFVAKGHLYPGLRLICSESKTLINSGKINLKTEKFAGELGNFNCLQKLYPIADVLNYGFISSASSTPLYSFIDEGVLSGPINKFTIIANDADFIQPSSYTTSGLFKYTCEIDAPIVRPENSSFRFRARAPLFNRETDIPPKFSVNNILLKDPSGNLIVKYKDFSFFGDDQYTTYSSLPLENRANLHDWDSNFPFIREASGYTLSFDVRSENLADPFDRGFDFGFEEYWRTPNFSGGLIDNLKISALEICNSGGFGPRIENKLNFYLEVDPTGKRLEKIIRPIGMPLYPKISEIWPVASSIWSSSDGLNNATKCGIKRIVESLRNDSASDYITMNSTGPIVDSGRLLIEFGHEPSRVNEVSRGAFGCAFDESTCDMWIEPTGAFNTLNKRSSHFDDNFFKVDTVSLRVLARKTIGSRDYALDIVGYSHDFLLNVTRPSGGFLQNSELAKDYYFNLPFFRDEYYTHPYFGVFGLDELPPILTTYPPDDLSIGAEALSDKDVASVKFLEFPGGDHYLLSTRPKIDSTEFKWYEIPLKIFPDNVLLGASVDYSMSSFFEHLFLDIYPIPSGAEIAAMQLLVRYAPQNAINISIRGGETFGKSDRFLTPSSRQINDTIINAGSGYSPRSLIQNIPHGYYDNNVKSNYSRRWRGMEGLVSGPFNPNQFGFDFYNPLLDYPFLSCYYDFNDTNNNAVYPRQGSGVLSITSNLPVYKYNNIGWRLINDSIFNLDLPGYSGLYRTLDWTALASGGSSFSNDILYGKIADAFSAALKIDGANSYAKLENIDISGGFSAYTRFSPGPKMSGINFNLWNSGVLLSKYVDSNIQFGINYSGGKLIGFCRDVNNNYIYIQDSVNFSDYAYPLSIVLTYNDNNSKRLKLYTNNELTPSLPRIRASSVAFDMTPGSGDLYLGYAPTSGVGVHGFITEFGLSNSGNIVQSGANLLYKQTSADTFFNNQHMHWWSSGESYSNDTYKLWDYINEDTQKDWTLGDFKYCDFNAAFSQLSKRTGRDLISFYIKNSGQPYSNFVNSAPLSVNSGVSYHTQIENDFLRFNLSDVDSAFYSANVRISKNLPRGYKFAERAIAVETVLEHESSGDFYWGPCEPIGPKLIVSLYAKNKEPYWKQDRWGLVNRSSHYLELDSCFVKIHSTFNYQDYIDDSEQWALFPREPYLSEFTEKYYSTDVNDMILQYDLVYPSGSPYYSRINIHSANVRLEDANVEINDANDHLNIMASSAFVDSNNLNLLLDANFRSSGLNLYIAGPFNLSQLGFPLFTSGAYGMSDGLNLNSLSYDNISGALFICTSGGPEAIILPESGVLNLHLLGKGVINQSGFPLTLMNIDSGNFADSSMNLFAFAANETSLYSNLSMFLDNNIGSLSSGQYSDSLNAQIIGSRTLISKYINNSLNMFIHDNNPKNSLNLVLYSDINDFIDSTSLNLYTTNYFAKNSDYINWYNYNYGVDIDLDDNAYASLPANDEIRGVDLIGYGACDSDSPKKAIDPAIITHETVWREAACNDGGIFRAINTYTGSGYSGNYYGIRKYEGLVPNVGYNVQMRITTGSTDPILVPNEWEEWEYGTNDETNFDNVKLIADAPSGVSRNTNDNYGYSVAVSKDLLAVGIPSRAILDESGVLIPSAGSISLYKRASEIAGKQAKWEFLDELILPSGYKKDYISATYENMLCFPNAQDPQFCVSGQRWNIGQEGRELGYSVDIANSGSRQVVVAGAPKAKWTRQFEDIITSGVPIAMMVFTDTFTYDKEKIASIAQVANKWNILYKYFAAPWYSPLDFQPQIDLKLIIYQLVRKTDPTPPINITEPWLYHAYLNRLDDSVPNAEASMLSGIWEKFNEAFGYDTNLIDNNIPAIVGVFQDDSPSTTFGKAFISGVNTFVEQYLPYSYSSGVISSIDGASLSGYVLRINGLAQQWETASQNLINTTLNYENLIASGNLKYITSGVGQEFARSNSYEFQIPPPSGGRVYIFENENNKFNLVQAIISPDEVIVGQGLGSNGDNAPSIYGGTYFDMFGQSVAISNDANIITVGSPYASENAQIYERQDAENDRMYSRLREWLVYKGLNNHINFYDNILALSGFNIATTQTYYNLSSSEKFNIRSDENFWNNEGRGGIIQLYKKIFVYRPSLMGTWQWLATDYAPTPRLGWSTDVNNEGTIAVFGAPTDSFNEYDDSNIWYDKNYNTWASYTNAGAVRVFESRNYYPHNLAIEYYKFGNLDKSIHPDLAASGYYDQMDEYFSPIDVPFVRTPFAQVDIPKEAGLAFIITPEIDAASDEIIQRIKDWLILGDRTLVLVGNDPLWEENGVYDKSNKIINKILEKLGSRMRLFPARSRYDSLPDCADVNNKIYNVTPSFVPDYAHSTDILAFNMYAKGVGDIRIDLSRDDLTNLRMTADCDIKLNPTCEMPLKHIGDLRAQWNAACQRTVGDKVFEIKYKENWPFHFGNSNPAEKCDDYESLTTFDYPNLEPRPILTAAEWLPGTSIFVPARSGCYTYIYPIKERVEVGEIYYEFAENHLPSSVFNIYENSDSEISGVFNSLQYGGFIDPEPFEDIDETRDALLQAVATPYFADSYYENRVVDNYQTIAAEENNVVLIATQFSENNSSFNINAGGDNNYYFYQNLVLKTCFDPGSVAQLGGWTGRNSFEDAYSDSILKSVLESYQNVIKENVISPSLQDNILWIANPIDKPNENQIEEIKNWLKEQPSGINKKLVITYNSNQVIANNVKYICEELNLKIAPFYSAAEDRYLTSNVTSTQASPVMFNNDNHIIKGCSDGYDWLNNSSTQVMDFNITPTLNNNLFIPISGGSRILYYDRELTERYLNTPDKFWKIDADVSTIKFPTLPGSGYRIFVDWVAEGMSEKYRINAFADKVVEANNPSGIPSTKFIGFLGNSFGAQGGGSVTPYIVHTATVDVRAPLNYLEIKFDTSEHFKIPDEGFTPKTPRILSVSGCLLPIEEIISTEVKEIIVGWVTGCIPWKEDEYTVIIPPVFRPISTEDNRYCNRCADQTPRVMEDGPVIVAEELENFSSFDNGLQRSRIVLISDSTMIQGQCPDYRNNNLSKNQEFIRSLYPISPTGLAGKQFSFTQKLIAPERGSPGKYHAISGIAGLAFNFGTGIYGNTGVYVSNENDYNPAIIDRPKDPPTEEERKKEKKNFEQTIIPLYRVFPRLSGAYLDPTFGGGTPDRVKAGLTDLIYEDQNYTGDLFGYGVAIHNDQILVGAINNGFVKENPIAWSGVINSGDFDLNQAGGAGAVFAFERTFKRKDGYGQVVPWEFKQKIKPSSLKPYDQFGYDISIDADFAAIGAPKHDYKTAHQHIYAGSAAFIRKEFNGSFNIPGHIIDNYSTEYIQDIGAVFTYENKLLNWYDKNRRWTLAERINASGYQATKTGDMFGRNVYIDRARRSDADYTLAVGAPLHDYATSGNHYTGTLSNAGAAFIYDAMLREQVEATPNSGSWISAKVFGAFNNDSIKLNVYQNTSGQSISYDLHGLAFTNTDGELYLEASGFDPATRGFIAHRPYVEFIKGQLADGTDINNNLNLFISGTPPSSQQFINLTILSPDMSPVYNNMNLYATSWNNINSGSGTPPLNIFMVGESGTLFSGGLNLFTSGIGGINLPLNLRIRGK